MSSPTAEQIIAVLRTAPRSTTNQVADALQEDFNVNVPNDRLRGVLNALCDDGLVARHDRNAGRPRAVGQHFVWWVPDG